MVWGMETRSTKAFNALSNQQYNQFAPSHIHRKQLAFRLVYCMELESQPRLLPVGQVSQQKNEPLKEVKTKEKIESRKKTPTSLSCFFVYLQLNKKKEDNNMQNMKMNIQSLKHKVAKISNLPDCEHQSIGP